MSDDFQSHVFRRRFHAKPGWTEQGLLVGAGTCLLPADTSARYEEAGERLLTILSVASGRPLAKSTLGHVEAARAHWQRGDAAMAHIRLAFAQLPRVTKDGAYRAFLADQIIAADMRPAALRTHLGIVEADDVVKFDESQPRVPAGSGRESGRWTSGDQTSGSDSKERKDGQISSQETHFPLPAHLGGETPKRKALPEENRFDDEQSVIDPYCKLQKERCIISCSDTALPTYNFGFKFYNCVNRCMDAAGCLGRA